MPIPNPLENFRYSDYFNTISINHLITTTKPIPVLDMAQLPSVAILPRVIRSIPKASKALRTSINISESVVVPFIDCSDHSSFVFFNYLSTPFTNIADCSVSF